MKKIFIIAAAALATLASCTKVENEVPQTTGNTIAFKAVNYKSQTTKAAGPIAGTTYKTTDPIFGVFGFFLPEGKTWAANSADAQDFMGTSAAALPVSYDDAATVRTWHTVDTYYWPFTGSVSFAAYTPYYANAAASGETGTAITASFDKTNGITFTDYSPAAAAASQVDLMYSTIVADQKDNTDANTGANASVYKGVPIVFNHALSQIQFNVGLAEDYGNKLTMTVKKLEIKLVNKASFTEKNSWNVPSAADGNSTEYTPITAETTLAYGTNGALEALTPMLVIPQKTANAIVVTYTMKQNGQAAAIEDTIEIPLFESPATDFEFVKGKKYVFDLKFGPRVIYFAPHIATDWDATENTVKTEVEIPLN